MIRDQRAQLSIAAYRPAGKYEYQHEQRLSATDSRRAFSEMPQQKMLIYADNRRRLIAHQIIKIIAHHAPIWQMMAIMSRAHALT